MNRWRTFAWQSHERELNSFANYATDIEGQRIHFVHERGTGSRPIPLVLSHGWPWSFWDYH